MATRKEPSDAEIAAEAAANYVARGGEHGHDMDDWLEAERRLTSRGSASGPRDTWQGRDANRRADGGDDLKA